MLYNLMSATEIAFKNLEVILWVVAGLGAFLIGFKLLSENLQSVANKGLRRLFDKTSKSKIAGVGIGAGATILMQSSGATTVMVIGFVNAGMMTLHQATAIIMGANIGTTVTTLLFAVGLTSIGKYFMVFSFVGIFCAMLFKTGKAKSWSLTVAGFGLVFFGLTMISLCMKSDYVQNSSFLQKMLQTEISPEILGSIVLLLIGAVITAVMQSSTAVNGILLTMLATGLFGTNVGNRIYYIVLGTNVGTCVTAMISSLGASTNAKRAALIHFLFNFVGSIIFLIVLNLWHGFGDFVHGLINNGEMELAVFHLAFNFICTLIFLPLTFVFVKVTEFIIKDKKKEEEIKITYMDERMLATPTVAIAQLQKETISMGDKCMANLKQAFTAFLERDVLVDEKVAAENEEIAVISKQITDYLIKVSGSVVSVHDDMRISILHHALGDMLRISEISDNMIKYTKTEVDKELSFSESVIEDMKLMFTYLEDMYKIAIAILETKNREGFAALDEIENKVDGMRKNLIDGHIKRLNEGSCSPASSAVFINLVSNLERVGDHITFIAHAIEELK